MWVPIKVNYFSISQQTRNAKVEAQLTTLQFLREENNYARMTGYKEVSYISCPSILLTQVLLKAVELV